MNRSLLAAALLMLGTFAIGCGNSPEALCKKSFELAKKEIKSDKEPTDAEMKEALDKCVKQVEEEKAKDPKKFECQADCLNKNDTMKDVSECTKSCKGEEKK